MPTTFVNFHAPISVHTAQNFMTVLAQKIVAGTDHFYILLSTGGGEIPSGITIYNFLRGLPTRLTMHNVGNVDSVGNAIFLAADERLTCAHSTFMFHGVGIEVKNTVIEEKRSREILDAILADQVRIADIIVARTNIDASTPNLLYARAVAHSRLGRCLSRFGVW